MVLEAIGKGFTKVFGSRNERLLKGMQPAVERIAGLEPAMKELSDAALAGKTAEFKDRLAKGEAVDDLLPEAFAVVREAAVRTLGMRPYDVQMIGGMVLHQGKIAEMATGEGKTLVATLPVYLNALTGNGVHVVTVNDYLAKRDRDWMGKVYEFLGLTAGVLQHDDTNEARREAYVCDITYGTNSEFGFDYLRDNMATRKEDQVQRRRSFAIVDEVDSILIDEARTPLIISGPTEEYIDKYYTAEKIARKLKPDAHYEVKEKEHQVILSEAGIEEAERLLGVESLYSDVYMDWPHHLDNALRAKEIYHRDREYVVQEGEVIIVDEFTGRLQPGRRWSDGLHQAVEAKEGLTIKRESQTLATVTIQNFFRLYDKLAGMTGTAITEAEEFYKIYRLDVVEVPTHRPVRRVDHADVIYGTEKEKVDAIEEEIVRLHGMGRPILVGTKSIEKSEVISARLQRRGIEHEVLNAKHHAREAQIVAKAGQPGQVTIATNMAGRGTDIVLGDGVINPKCVHAETGEVWCCIRCNRPERADGCRSCWKYPDRPTYYRCETGNRAPCPCGSGKKYETCCYPKHGEWADIPCGLHVLSTERHDARRIDNQLRGRCARQGDPGSSRFFLSLEDDLMRRFAGDWVRGFLQKHGMADGMPIESRIVSRSIRKAQTRVEQHHFEIRKNLLEYDGVMDEQRKEVYEQRQQILEGESLRELLEEWIGNGIESAVARHLEPVGADAEADPTGLAAWAHRKYGIEGTAADLPDPDRARATLLDRVRALYDAREKELGPEGMRRWERMLTLLKIDQKWKEHLYLMGQLKDGIGLRGYGQEDPKIAYKREGYELFSEMIGSVKEEITDLLLRAQAPTAEEQRHRKSIWNVADAVHESFQEHQAEQRRAAAATREPVKPIRRKAPKVGRNDPCPCGSGRKYKKCCGAA